MYSVAIYDNNKPLGMWKNYTVNFIQNTLLLLNSKVVYFIRTSVYSSCIKHIIYMFIVFRNCDPNKSTHPPQRSARRLWQRSLRRSSSSVPVRKRWIFWGVQGLVSSAGPCLQGNRPKLQRGRPCVQRGRPGRSWVLEPRTRWGHHSLHHLLWRHPGSQGKRTSLW